MEQWGTSWLPHQSCRTAWQTKRTTDEHCCPVHCIHRLCMWWDRSQLGAKYLSSPSSFKRRSVRCEWNLLSSLSAGLSTVLHWLKSISCIMLCAWISFKTRILLFINYFHTGSNITISSDRYYKHGFEVTELGRVYLENQRSSIPCSCNFASAIHLVYEMAAKAIFGNANSTLGYWETALHLWAYWGAA